MRRAVGWVLLVGVVLVLAAGAWTASRGWVAYSALQDVRDEVPAITSAVTSVDPDALAVSVARVRERSERALEATDDPLWRLASRFPLGGENLAALTTASGAVDRLADEGLPGLERVVGGVDDARTSLTTGQGLDLAALRGALDGLEEVQTASEAARGRLADIQGEDLLPQVEQARDDLREQLDLAQRAEELLGTVSLPGLASLGSLGSLGSLSSAEGLQGSLEQLRELDPGLLPDEVQERLRDLGGQVPEDLVPPDLIPQDLVPEDLLPQDLVPEDLLTWR